MSLTDAMHHASLDAEYRQFLTQLDVARVTQQMELDAARRARDQAKLDRDYARAHLAQATLLADFQAPPT